MLRGLLPWLVVLFVLPAAGFTPCFTGLSGLRTASVQSEHMCSSKMGTVRLRAAPLRIRRTGITDIMAQAVGSGQETGDGSGLTKKWDDARLVNLSDGDIVLRKGRPHELDLLAILSIEESALNLAQGPCSMLIVLRSTANGRW
jgi:hypothetical protein